MTEQPTAHATPAGVVPLSHAADMIRSARAYAATGDRDGVRRLIDHARVHIAAAIAEMDR